MQSFKLVMLAVVAGASLLTVPAMAAGDGTTATSATTTVPAPTTATPLPMQSNAAVPGTPTQHTPADAPAKASAVGSEGGGGK